MKSMRRAAGLVAALLLVLIGIVCLHGVMLPIGVALIVIGGVAALWQARILAQTREDPYDLKRLFDEAPTVDTPEEDVFEEDGVPFCHHCGHAVANPFARCPTCGNQVR